MDCGCESGDGMDWMVMYCVCQKGQGGRQRPAPASPSPAHSPSHPIPPPPHPHKNSTYGASSALSVIVGSLGTFGTGVILDQAHDWSWVYGIAAGVYVAGAVLFAGMYKSHKIFD